ncbi:MAG: HAMP domain-containing sensor histidine kinase [Actinomycetota bacterium]|nr:HAMP domain-containing sensor histidine kinase [Actinomycetota bacterium]
MKLRTRIVLMAAVAVAVAVILVSAAAFLLARRELRSEIDESLIERALVIQSLADDPRGIVGAGGPLHSPFGLFGGRGPSFDTVYYQVTLPIGEVLIPEGQAPLPLVDNDVALRQALLSDENVDGVHMRMITFVSEPLGLVQMARPLTEVDATLAGLAIALSFIGLIGVLLAAGAGVLVARSALKPIDDLAEAAEHVAETQDLAARIEVGTNDEVGRLARNFNAMLAALEESRAQQQRLVRDAGHELRTPLTALRTNIELLGRTKNLNDEQRLELITAAEAEVKDLSVLVGEVVDVASDRYIEGPIEELFLDDIVGHSVERAVRRTTVDVDVDSVRSPVSGRSVALARAVDNLLDNALKWGSDGERIEVVVADGRVSVRDHGPGIEEADRDHVFDRFYRSPSARSMPGSGLGLSIVKQIAEAHGGTVFAQPADGEGAIVGFEIPTR